MARPMAATSHVCWSRPPSSRVVARGARGALLVARAELGVGVEQVERAAKPRAAGSRSASGRAASQYGRDVADGGQAAGASRPRRAGSSRMRAHLELPPAVVLADLADDLHHGAALDAGEARLVLRPERRRGQPAVTVAERERGEPAAGGFAVLDLQDQQRVLDALADGRAASDRGFGAGTAGLR